ncbi:unnamed protein product [Caretta caretta]
MRIMKELKLVPSGNNSLMDILPGERKSAPNKPKLTLLTSWFKGQLRTTNTDNLYLSFSDIDASSAS